MTVSSRTSASARTTSCGRQLARACPARLAAIFVPREGNFARWPKYDSKLRPVREPSKPLCDNTTVRCHEPRFEFASAQIARRVQRSEDDPNREVHRPGVLGSRTTRFRDPRHQYLFWSGDHPARRLGPEPSSSVPPQQGLPGILARNHILPWGTTGHRSQPTAS